MATPAAAIWSAVATPRTQAERSSMARRRSLVCRRETLKVYRASPSSEAGNRNGGSPTVPYNWMTVPPGPLLTTNRSLSCKESG